jgi:diguanylate cyclase (GGDEF)-like protein/putative nucleotidyltransferase with HDIG domain
VRGIISDVTQRQQADAQLAEASDRFARLLDVVGEHVYLAQALPDGSLRELFQGPGADRLLGGAVADAEMNNWDAAVDPADCGVYAAMVRAVAAGEDADAEYRLNGADGITRWVHDRAVARSAPDGTVEISGIVSDVTERRRLRAELAETHAALSRVVDAMDDHLYTLRVDRDGSYHTVYRGPHREALAGGPIQGGARDDRLWESLLHPDDRERWWAAVARLPDGLPIELEYRVIGLDGVERIVLDRARPRREAGGMLFYDCATRDISERRRLEDELRRTRGAAELRARTDELTGTFNRRHFAEIVAASLAADQDGFGLLLLDADHFKQVNDAYGHVVGDAVLVELADRLRSELGAGDCLARWGGEEFAVLLRGVGSDAELDRRAQRLRAAVALLPVAAAGISVRLTISIGAVRSGTGLDSLDALVEAADRCLYGAKREGRNRVSMIPDHDGGEGEPLRDEPESVCVARALALVAGARGGPPEHHADEVSKLAARTARQLGLPEDLVLRCRLGGWLHDVGKVSVPERILADPGPLDAADWALIRTHPIVGEDMLRGVAALREASAAVRHHHERYDGSGYPDGLAGAAIPLEARIVAAADVFSAMTDDRPYSPARTPQEAAIELRRSSGSHLDPQVVDALLAVLGSAARPALRVA